MKIKEINALKILKHFLAPVSAIEVLVMVVAVVAIEVNVGIFLACICMYFHACSGIQPYAYMLGVHLCLARKGAWYMLRYMGHVLACIMPLFL